MTPIRELFRFAVVGTVGFATEAAVVFALIGWGREPHAVRLISVPVAVCATWWLNRIWTFASGKDTSPRQQLTLYFGVQEIASGGNLAGYSASLSTIAPTPTYALAALAAGSIAGMGINFLGSRRFVFVGGEARSADAAGVGHERKGHERKGDERGGDERASDGREGL